ncbi:hypothetical protein BIFGAL_04071 [Bifidobacterium gallicum DSM 20093 = LMG 11596]|uniref:Uncharacterized protein n=1 Tax=Bifidobacterium gallicum DSM 20093 = LMG 11596 TaxID=561180 RepID=D1NW26_9BIFI|nr:hypothetical protein BIFGAL_04071 [Bifidobacterium gallicum DSM 20093 = LMG 11596]
MARSHGHGVFASVVPANAPNFDCGQPVLAGCACIISDSVVETAPHVTQTTRGHGLSSTFRKPGSNHSQLTHIAKPFQPAQSIRYVYYSSVLQDSRGPHGCLPIPVTC